MLMFIEYSTKLKWWDGQVVVNQTGAWIDKQFFQEPSQSLFRCANYINVFQVVDQVAAAAN